VYQCRHTLGKLTARDRSRAKRRKVRGLLLTVDQREAPHAQDCDQVNQCDFRRVRLTREHRFAEKHAANRNAVKPAHEPAVAPSLHRMRVAGIVEIHVSIDDGRRYPRPGLPRPRYSCARLDHGTKRGIGTDLQSLLLQTLAQRPSDTEVVDEKYHPRIGAPPQYRLVAAVPGENSPSVRVQQSPGRELVARREQAVGLRERSLDRRERRVRSKPRNHVAILPRTPRYLSARIAIGWLRIDNSVPTPTRSFSMPETIRRCPWATKSALYASYHDLEWGAPVHDDRVFFEFLILEAAQAGLSWSTILNKRERYRDAFAGFDPSRVARFDSAKVARLMTDDGIVRNRLKIQSAIANAGAFLSVQREFGSFDRYVWTFVGGKPIVNRRRRLAAIPARTAQSDALSKDLGRRGFRFVGPTIMYAFMQATGLVNDHLVTCPRWAAVQYGTGTNSGAGGKAGPIR
jgi:DNA-3-methyladenine glycosylase I